jgi:hypothetical protein
MFHKPVLEEMWSLLRAAALFFLQPCPDIEGDEQEQRAAFVEQSAAAHESLKEYAVLAEKHFGRLLCKPNLHSLICRLGLQQLRRGHAAFFTEYWVEQMVQQCKRATKHRTTGCPALLVVRRWLLQLALQRVKANHPTVMTFDEMEPTWGAAGSVMKGKLLDLGAENGTGFLGAGGLAFTGGERQECMDALEEYRKTFPQQDGGGCLVGVTVDDLVRYVRAHREGVEILHSQAYQRPKMRASHYVKVMYEEQRGAGLVEVLYVADIKYFVGVKAPGTELVLDDGTHAQQVPLVLRLAISDLFEVQQESGPVGDVMHVPDIRRPRLKAYPVELSAINHKVVVCEVTPQSQCTRKGANARMFVPYMHHASDTA